MSGYPLDLPVLTHSFPTRRSSDLMLFPKYEVHDSVRFLSHWPTDWDTRVNDTDMFNLVHAPEAWAISQGDSNIIIGVLDTKINLVHPDLKGKYRSEEHTSELQSLMRI